MFVYHFHSKGLKSINNHSIGNKSILFQYSLRLVYAIILIFLVFQYIVKILLMFIFVNLLVSMDHISLNLALSILGSIFDTINSLDKILNYTKLVYMVIPSLY